MTVYKNITCIAYFACIKDHKVLLMQRNKHPRKGYYSFVGGHAHEGELLIEALKREVREEIDCEIHKLRNNLIRVTGKDNVSTTDQFFFDVHNLGNNIKGHTVELLQIDPNEVASTEGNNTVYNLFIGEIIDSPKTSYEVQSIRWEDIDSWIQYAKQEYIKIQPIDYLLLLLLKKYKDE